MTGFGHGEQKDGRVSLSLEIRSYNNRFLELFVNLPMSLKILEPKIREYLSSRVQRGKVELYFGLTETGEDLEMSIDPERVRMYMAAFSELKRLAGIKGRVSLSDMIGLEGIFITGSRRDPEALWALLLPLLERVSDGFQSSRLVEGKKTGEDIRRLAEGIRGHLQAVRRIVPRIEEKIVQGLRERFRQLLGDAVDDSRILSETAVLLMKFDVNEELQRMDAHLDTLIDALGASGSQGKRLDFLCQELGREINTIGSKSMMIEVDQAVISVKDALEKIREQLRNVE
jgi:uncharacterized protein (TIGR00255 family)